MVQFDYCALRRKPFDELTERELEYILDVLHRTLRSVRDDLEAFNLALDHFEARGNEERLNFWQERVDATSEFMDTIELDLMQYWRLCYTRRLDTTEVR